MSIKKLFRYHESWKQNTIVQKVQCHPHFMEALCPAVNRIKGATGVWVWLTTPKKALYNHSHRQNEGGGLIKSFFWLYL